MNYQNNEIFYTERIPEKDSYKYTTTYLSYYIDSILLLKVAGISERNILAELSKEYNFDCIKQSHLKKYISEYCTIKERGKYFIEQKKELKIVETKELDIRIKNINNYSEEMILNKIKNDSCNNYDSFKDMLIDYLIYNIHICNITKKHALSILYDILMNIEKDITIIRDKIDSMKSVYNVLSISETFFLNDIANKILLTNNFNIVEDIRNCNPFFLIIIFSQNKTEFLSVMDSFSIKLSNVINSAFVDLNERELLIVSKRNSIFDKQQTLEEIGQELDMTRERVRQIESKAVKKINNKLPLIKPTLQAIYYSQKSKRKHYITLENLKMHYQEDFIERLVMLYYFGNLNIRYDRDYMIIYDSDYYSIDDLVNNEIEQIGIIADYYETKEADLFLQNILDINYKKVKENLYIKKGGQYRDLYIDLVKELYPKGFNLSDDYENFIEIVKDRYKIEEIPTKHTLEAAILRSNEITLCDKSTYIYKKYAPSLSDDLVDKILNFISESNFTYYVSVLEKFKDELLKEGINNRYSLKGCIDRYLPEQMKSKRDYIINGSQTITPIEEMIDYMKSFPGEFSLNDLRNKFMGFQDYTLYNTCYSEIDNKLIFITTSDFIYLDKVNITEKDINCLKEFIDSLFVKLDTKILSSKKIYARLQLTNKELFSSLNLLGGHFHLFSLIKALFKDYYYSRPFISLEESYNTRESVIKKYVSNFDKFNMKTILDYQSKMNFGNLYSYLQFMDDMSDDYLQIDIDTMIKKETVNISELELLSIKNKLDLILNNFNVINTENFRGFSILPKIKYEWNKYLLVGIIRSYFPDDYIISTTTNKYDTTEYEIRRNV